MTFNEKTIESKYVYKGGIFNVKQHIVETVNGKTSIRDIIEHRGGVSIAAVTDEKKIILIRQFRKAAEDVLWEIPAGKIEADETDNLLSTAIRELKEETGYTADEFEYIGGYFASCGYDNEKIHLFICHALSKGQTDFDDTESIDTFEIDLSEALAMIDRKEIVDGKTVIGILTAARKYGVS